MSENQIFADRIRQAMKEKNLRQTDVLERAKPYCEQLGIAIDKSHLSQYCSGAITPNRKRMFVLSKVLDVSVYWLNGIEDADESAEMRTSQQTRNVAKYVNDNQISLKEMARATGIQYHNLHASLIREERDRDLRVGEFFKICKYLEVSPEYFDDEQKEKSSSVEDRLKRCEESIERIERLFDSVNQVREAFSHVWSSGICNTI